MLTSILLNLYCTKIQTVLGIGREGSAVASHLSFQRLNGGGGGVMGDRGRLTCTKMLQRGQTTQNLPWT